MKSLIAVTLVLVCLGPLLLAQDTAELAGMVKDQSGAVVPKVEIKLVSQETGGGRTAQSNDDGLYTLPGLRPATYDIEVRKVGFQTQAQTGVKLSAGDRLRLDFTLKVGESAQTVTISEDLAVITPESGTLQNTIGREQINDLPLSGRNAASLVLLSPGTSDLGAGNSNGRGVLFQIGTYPGAQAITSNGSRADGMNYYLDGGNNLDPYTNVNNPFPNPDALEEFSVQTNNFSAENGRATGAVVSVITRSGTNSFHGTAFDYLRNQAFNARNFFSTKKDSLKRNQFGGSFGGALVKDRLFFFSSYQGTRVSSTSDSQSAYVMTAAERNGDFSALSSPIRNPLTGAAFPGNKIPLAYLDSVTKNLLNYIPVATSSDGLVRFSSGLNREHEDQEMGRLDYHFSDKHRFYARYFHSEYPRDATLSKTNLLAAKNGAEYMNQNGTVSHTFVVSPTLLNSFVFSYNQTDASIISAAPFSAADLGVNIAHSTPPGLSIHVSGYFGFNTREPGEFNRHNFHVADNLHWSLGKHEIAFGGDYVRMNVDINNHYGQNGSFYFYPTFTGNSLADLFVGMQTGFLQGGGEYAARRGNQAGLFAQDNIRVNQRLSVNAGLRWDPYLPYGDELGRTLCYRPGQQSTRFINAPQGALYAGDAGCPAGGSASQWAQLSPRAGFSLSLDSKTIVRGGAGIFYQPPFVEAFNNMVDSAPFSPQYLIYAVPFADPFKGMTNPFPAQFAPTIPSKDVAFSLPMTGVSNEANWKPTQVVSWNVTLERQLPSAFHARIAYVGSKGTHLSYNTDLNAPIYGPGASTDNIDARRPQRNFQPIIENISGANSIYHSLQLSVNKKWSHGLSLDANYTWSRSLDWNSSASDLDSVTVINPWNARAYRGPSDFNTPQRFVLSSVWALPSPKTGVARRVLGDWQASGIWNWQSGFPLTIDSGEDNSATGITNDLADVIRKPSYTSGSKADRIQQWFSTSAFVPNAAGTFGNSGRGILSGPGTFSIDFSMQKNLAITERIGIRIRGEAFNALNHTLLNNPGTTVSSGGFGTINGARDPRIMQLSAKFTF